MLRALESCVDCWLPENVEFVIVDNASEDGTMQAVDCFFRANSFEYQYDYLPHNIGAAAGRNEGFRRSRGKYVYFMDDDAYVEGPKPFFFANMMNFLEQNRDVFCVTTSIYDTGLNRKRSVIGSRHCHANRYCKALMFHAGSFLVDRQRAPDQENLFSATQFGWMEELYPSLKSFFRDRYVVEMNDLNVIHDPNECSRYFTRQSIVLHYVGAVRAKLVFYPSVSYPLLYVMFCLRLLRHLGFAGLVEALEHLARLTKGLTKETVPFSRFMKLIQEFGFVPSL